MKPFHLSISHTLLLALLFLLMLFVTSSFMSWLAFNQVRVNQQQLLDQSLPAMRFVESAVNTGAELLNVGESLSRPLTKAELSLFEKQANTLLEAVKSDLQLFRSGELGFNQSSLLIENTQYLIDTVKEQIALQHNIINNQSALQIEHDVLLASAMALLIDIRLVRSDIALALLSSSGSKKESLAQQMAALIELRFDAQRLSSLINESLLLERADQVAANEDLYRVQMQKLSVNFLEFDTVYREKLAVNINALNDGFLKSDNYFYQLANRVQAFNKLALAKDRSAELNKVLVSEYQKRSQQANIELDSEAKNILQLVATSKVIIIVAIVLSVIVILLFAFLFLKPRIVNRLHQLAEQTRAIANNEYDIAINISGADEISAMAESLAYFRDQLVEKEVFQQTLSDREQTLSTIIDNATEGLLTVDTEGFIQTFNPACEKIFDIFTEQAVTKKIERFFPDDQSLFWVHRKQAPVGTEAIVVCQDKPVVASRDGGEVFYGSLSISLLSLSGRLVYSCFIRDVTADKKAKEQVEKLIDELSASNADLESFAYSCSHDLQEPIRIISAFTQLLEERLGDHTDDQVKKYLGFISRSSDEAKELIKSILEYSRLDHSSVDKDWVNLDHLCARVNDSISIILQECNGVFTWRADNVRLYGVESQLFQVVINLVVNGIKYNNSQQPEVSLTVSDEKAYSVLVVEDNGIGIHPRYHEQIFELFNRLVSKKDYAGSGIGLSLCKKIVERHEGSITLESEEGKGSRFYLRLPKAKLMARGASRGR